MTRPKAKGTGALLAMAAAIGLSADLDRQGITIVVGADRVFNSRTYCLDAYQAAEAGQRLAP